MTNSYLWDKTGEPDPFVQQLERKLACRRYPRRRSVTWHWSALAALLVATLLLAPQYAGNAGGGDAALVPESSAVREAPSTSTQNAATATTAPSDNVGADAAAPTESTHQATVLGTEDAPDRIMPDAPER